MDEQVLLIKLLSPMMKSRKLQSRKTEKITLELTNFCLQLMVVKVPSSTTLLLFLSLFYLAFVHSFSFNSSFRIGLVHVFVMLLSLPSTKPRESMIRKKNTHWYALKRNIWNWISNGYMQDLHIVFLFPLTPLLIIQSLKLFNNQHTETTQNRLTNNWLV